MSEFHEVQRTTRKGMASWYDRTVPHLTDEQRADLDEALADREIFPRSIMIVLERWGHKVSPSQITWHRKTHGL